MNQHFKNTSLLALVFLTLLISQGAHSQYPGDDGFYVGKKEKGDIPRDKVRNFNPHITTRGVALAPLKIAFEPLPSVSSYSSIAYNSLSFGFLERFQIGTSPLLYATESHRINFNFKWNFYRSENAHWAFHYSTFKFKLPNSIIVGQNNDGTATVSKLNFNSWGLAMNFFPSDRRFGAGFNFNFYSIDTENETVNKILEDEATPVELMADFDMTVTNDFHVTFGVGRTRAHPFDAFKSKLPFGYGFTGTYLKKQGILQPISAGVHYLPTEKDYNLMLSVGIDLS